VSADTELPAGSLAWIESLTGCAVTATTRHVARREAWLVDVAGEHNGYFLRIDRGALAGREMTRGLKRETGLLQALERFDVRSQRIIGWNEALQLALQERVHGSADLHLADADEQHDVMMDFMAVLARLHNIDIDELSLAEFERPGSIPEHSLAELRAVEQSGQAMGVDVYSHPLAAFGKRWLENHVPQSVHRTVLLQGDTGPGNFLFEDHRVSAVVDWEWAHYGDPMEDLGNLWVRDFFYPSSGGQLARYFEHYASLSGIPLEPSSIHYYRVHQLVRSTMGLFFETEPYRWRSPLALNLGYRALIERGQCEAMADAMGVTLRSTAIPEISESSPQSSLAQALARQLKDELAPALDDDFLANRALHAVNLARVIDRQARYAAEFEALEREGLSDLLGRTVDDLAEGRGELLALIRTLPIDDELPVLQFFADLTRRSEALLSPFNDAWRHCRWASY
jgi:aminoglycoside phosphotransferase (APT) family kinase protein